MLGWFGGLPEKCVSKRVAATKTGKVWRTYFGWLLAGLVR